MMKASLGQKTENILTFINLHVICKTCLCTIYISPFHKRNKGYSTKVQKTSNLKINSNITVL